MTDSKAKASKSAKPASGKRGSDSKPVTDLDLDQSQSGTVRGGTAAYGGGNAPLPNGAVLPGKVSDAGVKSDVTKIRNALARLRDL